MPEQIFELFKAQLPVPTNPPCQDGHAYVDASNQATLPFGPDVAVYNTDPTQLSQGDEGDCGALAGLLAVAAMQPKMLINHLHYLGIDASYTDLYSIDLYIDGSWRPTVINASMPQSQARSHLGNTVMWGPLYEKALAVARGGYASLAGINTTEVIAMVTGQPTEQLVGGGASALQALKDGFSVTGVGVTTGWQDDATGQALADWKPGALYVRDRHYYAIGGFVDASMQRVVLINPWNQGPGDGGNFSISTAGFIGLFWGYGVSHK